MSWEEEGPEPASQEANEQGEEGGGVPQAQDEAAMADEQKGQNAAKGGKRGEKGDAGISRQLFKDLEKTAIQVSGQAQGEELSPYHVPVSSAVIPWWDARAWENRAKQFRAERGSHGQGEDLPATSRHSGADALNAAVADGGRGMRSEGDGATPDQSANARDEWGNVLLSQSRASFPKGGARKGGPRSVPAVEGQRRPGTGTGVGGGNVDRPGQQMQTEGAESEQGRVEQGGGLTRGAGLADGLLDDLEAIERMDRIAKKRLIKFQDRMTPKGFKGGTIIKDHIDFGGGKGADLDGQRNAR